MMNRRLLAGWVILCFLGLLAPSAGWGQAVKPAATKPATATAARFVLQLAGTSCGFLKSATGGMATADVIKETTGADMFTKKHVSGVKYEDITIQVDMNACKGLYDWIGGTLKGQSPRQNGAIVAADMSLKEVSRIEFTNALITEIGFPALDGAAKDPAYLTVKLSPQTTQRKKGMGGTLSAGTAQKKWQLSNFKFEIAGLDTTRVNRIDAFTVKQAVVSSSVGEARMTQKQPGRLEIANLSFTLGESFAEPFYTWHEDFVVKGKSGDANERAGSLVWLSPEGKELGRLNLFNMGIFRLSPVEAPAGPEAIRRVRVDVYVERMEFNLSK